MVMVRMLGAWVLVIGLILGVPALYSVYAGLPPNAITLPLAQWVKARQWAPQGWGFFTRNPREAQLLPYVRDKLGTWRLAHVGPHAQLKYAFGLNRRSRAQGVEMGLLLKGVGRTPWTKCDLEPTVCLDQLSVGRKLANISPVSTLCGQVAFVKQEPVPWAWAINGASETMPSEVIGLEISCWSD